MTVRAAAIASLAVLAAAGCGGPPAPTPLAATPHADVRAEFDAMCAAIAETSNEYYGRARIAELERFLDAPAADPRGPVIVRGRLGMELLRVGEARRAAALLDEAVTLAEALPGDDALRDDVLRRAALAWLRIGEQSNCVGHHGPDSCILPIRGSGVHPSPEGSRAALERYRRLSAAGPVAPTVAWLANVAAWTAAAPPDALPPALRVPATRLRSEAAFPEFGNVAMARGVHVARPSGGAILDDFDGDGDLDLVTSSIDPCAPLTFHRNDGDGTFEDATAGSGLEHQLGGLHLVHADVDGDDDLDLMVLRGGWLGADGRMRNSLLRNDGTGRFEDVTAAAGLAEPAYPTQAAAFADYDLDGDLDLYVGNEADDDGRAYPSQLWRNRGDGTFEDVARSAGVDNLRFAKGVAWGDADDDGDPDLYVSNLGPNRMYRNDGDGTFEDVAQAWGVAEPSGRSFPTWFFDHDQDGDLDLFVASYDATLDDVAAWLLGADVGRGRPYLYRNDGDGRFVEIGADVGLDVPCLPMGSGFGDLDGNGFPDVYLGTGTPSFESLAPNLLFAGDGDRFVDVTAAARVGHLQKGHAVAFGDVDRDGDLDLFEQMGGAYPGDAYPSVLYDNPIGPRPATAVRLRGTRAPRTPTTARLAVDLEGPDGTRTVRFVHGPGGSFAGSPFEHLVVPREGERIARFRVRWPDGTTETWDAAPVGGASRVLLVEGAGEPRDLD